MTDYVQTATEEGAEIVDDAGAGSNSSVRVIAGTGDGSKQCELDLTVGTTYSDLVHRLGKDLQLDDFDCTYSLNAAHITAQSKQHSTAYQHLSITSDLDVMAAIFTAATMPDKVLYVKAEARFSGTLNSLTLPAELRSFSKWKQPLSVSSVQEWDLMEDMSDVKTFWKELPPVHHVPFAHILFSYKNHLPHRNLSQRMQALSQRGVLQEIDWRTFLDAEQRLVREADLRLRVYHCGVAPSMRPVVWRHLLFVFPPLLSAKERQAFLNARHNEYEQLKASWHNIEPGKRSKEVATITDQVHNDVIRTDRNTDFFRDDDSPHLDMLYNVLVTFALNSPDISYVQGLNDYAAVFLQIYGNEADTYICLHSMMRLSKALFTPEGLMVKFAHLKALLQRFDNDMHEHLSSHNSQELIFCYRWLLLDMKREFSESDAQRVFDVLWSTLSPPKEYASSWKRLSDVKTLTVTGHEASGAESDGNQGVRNRHHSESEVVAIDKERKRARPSTTVAASMPNYVESEVRTEKVSWTVIDLISEDIHEYQSTEVLPVTPEDSRAVELGQVALTASWSSSQSTASFSHQDGNHEECLSDRETRQLPQESDSPSDQLNFSMSDDHSKSKIVVDSPEYRLSHKGTANQMASSASAELQHSAVGHVVAGVADCSEYAAIGSNPEDNQDDDNILEMSDLCDNLDHSEEIGEISRTYGSLFSLFMCVATLTLHRRHLLRQQVSEESLAIYFERQRKHHRADKVLSKARRLFAQYLQMEMTPLLSQPRAKSNTSVVQKLLQRQK